MTRTIVMALVCAAFCSMACSEARESGGKVTNIVVNKNAIPNPPITMPGEAITVLGPDDDGSVDHVRISQYGFAVDPLFTCNFANGTAAAPTIVQNQEALCTFQARGCTLENGCELDGTGYGPSTVQFRIMACQDWTPTGRCTRVQMSTTQRDTTIESAKVNWSDGGHIEYGNSLPQIGEGCGTGASIVGSDNGFKVTVGRSPQSSCVVIFNNAWTLAYKGMPYAPVCVAGNETSPQLLRAVNVTSTSLTLVGLLRDQDVLNVICVGHHNLP